jgi:hypothetical protein
MRAHLLLPLLLIAAFAPAQESGRRHWVPGAFDRFTTDELGNIYAQRGDELELYSKRGDFLLRNSLKTFGRISKLDAFYSFKPMVFSREMGLIALLDNTLAVQGSVIDLNRGGFPQVSAACASVQNCFWFFDERELTLMRVDPQLRQLANTGRIDQLLGFAPKPVDLQEHDSRLYMNDAREGIVVFDLFGTYMRKLPIKGARQFEVRGRRLYFLTEEGAFVYDLRDFTIDPLPLPADVQGPILGLRVELDRLYLHTAAGILIVDLPRS